MESVIKKYRIDKKGSFVLSEHPARPANLDASRKEAKNDLAENTAAISVLQQKLYAEKKEGLIIVFQAMDAAGKDGTIRAVFGALSPQGVTEYAFKTPSAEELAHDYLWRVSRNAPERGDIAIFNRSHYEDVLIGKVHELYKGQKKADRIKDSEVISRRYRDICNFEEYLYNNSIRTVKIYLNVSKEEQAARFLARLSTPEKVWKFSAGDMKEREFWDSYIGAFHDAINETATKKSPWYIVPADRKWYMRYIVSCIVKDTLEDMNPQFPSASEQDANTLESYKSALESQLSSKI